MNLLKLKPCIDRRTALHGNEGHDVFECAGRITFGRPLFFPFTFFLFPFRIVS